MSGRIVGHLGRHWFLYAIPATLALSWAWPEAMRAGGAWHAEAWWQGLIVAIFLASGLSLPAGELRAAAGRWRLHLAVQGVSLLAIPLLAWAAKPLLVAGLGEPLAFGCLLLACQPTTIAGCIALTRAAQGDVAAALFNATAGSLLGVFATPVLSLLLTGIVLETSFGVVLLQLAELVLVPLIIGQVARRLLGEARGARLAPWAGRATLVCLVGICWHAFSDGFHKGLPPLPAQALPLLLLAVVGGHLAVVALTWRLGAWRALALDPPGRVALAIVATQKTAALGIPMLTVMFAGDPRLALFTLPILIWHPTQMVVATVLAPRYACFVRG